MSENKQMKEEKKIRTKLYTAVLNGNVANLKKLLTSDKINYKEHINDLYEEDRVEKSLLYIASEKRDIQCLTELIKHGADLNITSSNKKTPLYIAAEKGGIQCLTELIKHGADLNITSSNKKTPLYIAAEKGNKECLILLLDKGADKDKGGPYEATPAFIAALKKHQNCLTELIKRGAPVKRRDTIFEIEGTVANDLHKAIDSGDAENLKSLINDNDLSEIINKRDATGKTVFHLAVEKNRKQCLDLLIESVPDEKKPTVIDKPNVYGYTPLYIAAILKNDCFALLKENVANFSKTLYSAALEGQKECLQNFIQEDINFGYKAYKRCSKTDAQANGENNSNRSGPGEDEAQTRLMEDHSTDASETRCFKCYIKEDDLKCTDYDEGETQCLKCFIEEDGDCLVHEHDDPCSNSLIEEIFAHVNEPVNFINHVFDSTSVDIEKSKMNKEKIYRVDFKMFLPKRDTDRGQMHVFACLLKAMNNEEEISVLNNIFCQIFLEAKLKTRTLFWILLFRLFIWYAYFACVVLYTAVVLNIFEFASVHLILISTMGIFLLIRILLQINQILLLLEKRQSGIYSGWTIVKSVLVIVSVIFTMFYLIVTASFTNNMIHDNEISTLSRMMAIIIIILHNIEFIMIHLKFTTVSQYYSMFLIVLYKTLKAIVFLFLPISCFIIIFHIQFLYNSEFSTFFRSLVKTIVLMTGEFEYEKTLQDECNLTASSADRSNLELFYVRFIFLAFIILVNLVLLNLIIGLSVDNVARAKKAGNAVSIRQKAEFCIQVENFLRYVKKKSGVQWIKNLAGFVEKHAKVESPYEMKRSKIYVFRQKTFDSLDEFVRNANLSKQQNDLFTLVYNSSGTSQDEKKK
ncbi:hypothetical protein Zmor_024590 [Zophobas morio]|uniref:Uncharacterized protein n=1 Tax=Zophobas morio TaxID=2755281 RepID=A0AA38I138_9CUCU|nr:hypothetical protein Zmor_024590 [Zophobas morio]